jgi:hypothetical protein
MGRKTFSILFMIRRGQLLINHEAPIYMRITIDGERAEISIKRSVDPSHLNEIKGCAKTGSPYARHVTSRKHPESYIQDIYNIKDYLLRDVDHAFIVKYETYLRTKRNCCKSSKTYYGLFG